ncbi:MAG: hypothetical protein ACKO2K_06900 [Alphaproteobacteria bacterium]
MASRVSSNAARRIAVALSFPVWVVLATLALAEILLFATRPLWDDAGAKPPEASGMPTQERYWCYRYHPVTGYVGLPDVRWQAPWGTLVTQNARGERGPDVPLARGAVPRVVLLGDSQTWCFGVADDETLGVRLAESLGRLGRPGTEVVNLGTSGYGIDQSVLAWLVRGRDYAPDVVVFTWFAANDLAETESVRTHGVAKPIFLRHDDRLCLANVPVPRAEGWPDVDLGSQVVRALNACCGRTTGRLAGGTNIVRFLHGRAGLHDWRAEYEESIARVRGVFPCVLGADDGSPRGETVGRELLATLARDVAPRARLVVLSMPTPADLEAGRRSASYAGFLDGLREDGITVVDPFDALGPAFAEGRAIGHAARGDDHLSAEGTVIAAGLLAEWVAPMLAGPGAAAASPPVPAVAGGS